MHLARYRLPDGQIGVGRVEQQEIWPLDMSGVKDHSLFQVLEADDPQHLAEFLTRQEKKIPLDSVQLLPPIEQQEVWAAGVTYKRSRAARMEESTTSADCYDRVYASPRPEIFFKASPHRCAGPGQPLRIRADSNWNVPEPEMTLVVSTKGKLVGFTIGNDMSSRDIEGDNPLYLPQAKVYNQCCGLGPWITLPKGMPPREEIGIRLVIRRDKEVVFQGQTGIAQMARSFENLIGWFMRDNSYPTGAFLLTGTGIVPDSTFTLLPKDVVDISIDGIGTLSNPIVQG